MSAASQPVPQFGLQTYQQAWTESIRHILERAAGSPFSVEVLPLEPGSADSSVAAQNGVWVRISAAKNLKGEQAFLLGTSDALRLAQILTGAGMDETATLAAGDRDALKELFRQAAGRTTSSLKANFGADVELQFRGTDRPAWKPALQVGFRFTGKRTTPLLIYFQAGAELAADLRFAPAPFVAVRTDAAAGPPPAAAFPAGMKEGQAEAFGKDENLDLLLDVELDVALRFGERQMLLRDVLELSPGAVVELDRKVHEPAELVVAGKVLARGEVVIVDGSYGLRVTEIASPQQPIPAQGE